MVNGNTHEDDITIISNDFSNDVMVIDDSKSIRDRINRNNFSNRKNVNSPTASSNSSNNRRPRFLPRPENKNRRNRDKYQNENDDLSCFLDPSSKELQSYIKNQEFSKSDCFSIIYEQFFLNWFFSCLVYSDETISTGYRTNVDFRPDFNALKRVTYRATSTENEESSEDNTVYSQVESEVNKVCLVWNMILYLIMKNKLFCNFEILSDNPLRGSLDAIVSKLGNLITCKFAYHHFYF